MILYVLLNEIRSSIWKHWPRAVSTQPGKTGQALLTTKAARAAWVTATPEILEVKGEELLDRSSGTGWNKGMPPSTEGLEWWVLCSGYWSGLGGYKGAWTTLRVSKLRHEHLQLTLCERNSTDFEVSRSPCY